MKYSEKNKPWVCMQTHSSCYNGTWPVNMCGVLIHSTGANNPNLKRYVQPYETDVDYKNQLEKIGTNKNKNDLNHAKSGIGMNAWIGKDAKGEVMSIQTIPWEWRPWGCGGGSNGSCNDGWIQFEICEDGLNNKDYFEKVYKEACELTAYLCKKFNFNPKGTVKKNGISIPVILCHQDAARLGFASNHGDVLHWFPKFGKDMDDFRDDVAKLLEVKTETTNPYQLYRVRTEWNKPLSQVGAFKDLEKAKAKCDEMGPDYEVYDETGEVVYPLIETPKNFKVGDEVKLVVGATYVDGKAIPSWLYGMTLYVREVQKNNRIIISTLKTGLITGTVYDKYLEKVEQQKKVKYTVRVKSAKIPAYSGPGSNYNIIQNISTGIYTIIAENNGFGKLKTEGAGWIELSKVQKL